MEVSKDVAVSSALLDIVRAADAQASPWCLIGGQALRAYAVDRSTGDIDILVESDKLDELATELVEQQQWIPLTDKDGEYVEVKRVEVLEMRDDPVLMDIGEDREMIALRSPFGQLVELLAAQHPIEQEMIERAAVVTFHGVKLPLAPLGGILLVKAKADRTKDIAAIEQVAEMLSPDTLEQAVKWARKRDQETARDLKQMIDAAKARKKPGATREARRMSRQRRRRS